MLETQEKKKNKLRELHSHKTTHRRLSLAFLNGKRQRACAIYYTDGFSLPSSLNNPSAASPLVVLLGLGGKTVEKLVSSVSPIHCVTRLK